MSFMQVLFLGATVVVFTLIYNIWKEFNAFIATQHTGDAPPPNLNDIISRAKNM